LKTFTDKLLEHDAKYYISHEKHILLIFCIWLISSL